MSGLIGQDALDNDARRAARPQRLLEYFDRAFVINLPERTDRRRSVEAELVRAGLVDPSKVEFFRARTASELAGFPSLGAHGCFLSHLAILRQAQREGLRSVLIIEDDLAISPLFVEREAQIVERLCQDDWALAYLGYGEVGDPLPPSPIGPYADGLGSAHFYAVRGEYIEKVAHFLEEVLSRPPGDPRGGRMHLDGALYTYRLQHPQALTLATNPTLGTQSSSRSDITPNWYDRVPLLRVAAATYRWARRRFSSRGFES
ncbi:MAG: glycosyltransferase family 25 protein [Myxococcales bacterium]